MNIQNENKLTLQAIYNNIQNRELGLESETDTSKFDEELIMEDDKYKINFEYQNISDQDDLNLDAAFASKEFDYEQICNRPNWYSDINQIDLKTYDVLISFNWVSLMLNKQVKININNDFISNLFDCFELWWILQYNNQPVDFGGSKIGIIIPNVDKNEATILLRILFQKYNNGDTQIGINKRYVEQIQNIIFIDDMDKDTYLEMKYVEDYNTSNPSRLILVDGKYNNLNIKCNLLLIKDIINIKEKIELNKVSKVDSVCFYIDNRIITRSKELLQKNKNLYNISDYIIPPEKIQNKLSPRVKYYTFTDTKLYNFLLLKTLIKQKANYQLDGYQPENIHTILLLIDGDKFKNHKNYSEFINTDKFMDAILDSIPERLLNDTARYIKSKQKALYNTLIESSKIPSLKYLSLEQLLEIKDAGEIFQVKHQIEDRMLNENDVVHEEPKVKIKILGLSEESRIFESKLASRAITRGMSILIESIIDQYLLTEKNEKYISSPHIFYDTLLVSTTKSRLLNRLIVEATCFRKNIIFTEKIIKTNIMNPSFNILLHDLKYLWSLNEKQPTEITTYPQSRIARNILGNWAD